MSKPYKCPVCDGKGYKVIPAYSCPGCNGTGIVWSPSDEPDEEIKKEEHEN